MLMREGVDRWNALRFGLVLSGGGAKGAYDIVSYGSDGKEGGDGPAKDITN